MSALNQEGKDSHGHGRICLPGFLAQGHPPASLRLLFGFESRSVGERKKTCGTRVMPADRVFLLEKVLRV